MNIESDLLFGSAWGQLCADVLSWWESIPRSTVYLLPENIEAAAETSPIYSLLLLPVFVWLCPVLA